MVSPVHRRILEPPSPDLRRNSRVSPSPMCKSKKSIRVVESKTSNSRPGKSSYETPRSSRRASSVTGPSSSNFASGKYSSGSSYGDFSGTSTISTQTTLTSLIKSLPENPHIYEFSEIRCATNNFIAKRFSAYSWRCSIRGKDVVVFQRKLRRPTGIPELQDRLTAIGKSHHMSLIKLLGASISGNYIYLVYDYVPGANLAECLRNPKNPNFTVLSNWISRMQIAADLAHGLEYIHHSTGESFVHNHIKSSSIIITEPSMNAKICHFGTAELCGEIATNDCRNSSSKGAELHRVSSGAMKITGTRGYMAPEVQLTGIANQKTDVFAFGVVILELLSGKEPLKYRLCENNGSGYERESVIESAREAVDEGRLWSWLDRRLKDSYLAEAAEKMARVALECVDSDPVRRPGMGRVAGTVSKLLLESQAWAESIGLPTDFSVSMAPR